MANIARMSPYVSIHNNPIRFVDPDGREGQDWVRAGKMKTGVQADDKEIHWVDNIKNTEQAKAAGYLEYYAPGSLTIAMLKVLNRGRCAIFV